MVARIDNISNTSLRKSSKAGSKRSGASSSASSARLRIELENADLLTQEAMSSKQALAMEKVQLQANMEAMDLQAKLTSSDAQLKYLRWLNQDWLKEPKEMGWMTIWSKTYWGKKYPLYLWMMINHLWILWHWMLFWKHSTPEGARCFIRSATVHSRICHKERSPLLKTQGPSQKGNISHKGLINQSMVYKNNKRFHRKALNWNPIKQISTIQQCTVSSGLL